MRTSPLFESARKCNIKRSHRTSDEETYYIIKHALRPEILPDEEIRCPAEPEKRLALSVVIGIHIYVMRLQTLNAATRTKVHRP